MSLILCLSPAYQPLLCGLVGRDVCVPHFVSLTGVPASIFHPSSMHYNMSIIISIFMQERSVTLHYYSEDEWK